MLMCGLHISTDTEREAERSRFSRLVELDVHLGGKHDCTTIPSKKSPKSVFAFGVHNAGRKGRLVVNLLPCASCESRNLSNKVPGDWFIKAGHGPEIRQALSPRSLQRKPCGPLKSFSDSLDSLEYLIEPACLR